MKKKILTTQKMIIIFLIVFVVYSSSILIRQQLKLSSYSNQKAYYESLLKEKEDKNKELVSMQENVNSPEYIEEIASDKLDMYLPNERVYIDISK